MSDMGDGELKFWVDEGDTRRFYRDLGGDRRLELSKAEAGVTELEGEALRRLTADANKRMAVLGLIVLLTVTLGVTVGVAAAAMGLAVALRTSQFLVCCVFLVAGEGMSYLLRDIFCEFTMGLSAEVPEALWGRLRRFTSVANACVVASMLAPTIMVALRSVYDVLLIL